MKMACPNCHKEIDNSDVFCPHCGNKTNFGDEPLTISQKTKIYLASFFLSPLGLIWFFKYFRDKNPENKKVAHISLVITLTPIVLLAIVGGSYLKSFSAIIDTYQTNLDAYTELGL